MDVLPELYESNTNSHYLYIRHAQSLYNHHSEGIDEELIKSNKEFLDAHLSELGVVQSIGLQEKITDLNIKYVFCSPLMRCIQTCYNSLKKHPRRENIIVYIHPLINETVHCVHDYSRKISLKKSIFNKEASEVKFDWSIFDSYFAENHQESFYLDYVDTLKNDEHAQFLIKKIRSLEPDDSDTIEETLVEFSKYFASKKTRPESLKNMFQRNLNFREYLKTLEIDPSKQEKVLVFTHSCFIKIATSKLAYQMDQIDDFPQDSYMPSNCEIVSIINE